MAVKTAGTNVFFLDPDTGEVVEVDCVTSVTGITADRSQLDNTCLSSQSMQYLPGMTDPGQASIAMNFDPSQPSHIRLHELYRAGTVVEWAVGWADGTGVPTAGTSDDFELPTTRSWLYFPGYVSTVPFDFAVNSLVSSSVTVQLADFPYLQPAA